jgi:hypothetical protein
LFFKSFIPLTAHVNGDLAWLFLKMWSEDENAIAYNFMAPECSRKIQIRRRKGEGRNLGEVRYLTQQAHVRMKYFSPQALCSSPAISLTVPQQGTH